MRRTVRCLVLCPQASARTLVKRTNPFHKFYCLFSFLCLCDNVAWYSARTLELQLWLTSRELMMFTGPHTEPRVRSKRRKGRCAAGCVLNFAWPDTMTGYGEGRSAPPPRASATSLSSCRTEFSAKKRTVRIAGGRRRGWRWGRRSGGSRRSQCGGVASQSTKPPAPQHELNHNTCTITRAHH